jgi:hypothetical protein
VEDGDQKRGCRSDGTRRGVGGRTGSGGTPARGPPEAAAAGATRGGPSPPPPQRTTRTRGLAVAGGGEG